MSNNPDVTLATDNTICVRGLLDLHSVGRYRTAAARLFDDLPEIVLDLEETEAKGSAAVALLISLQREALRAGKNIEFRNAPDSILSIADACGVKEIIPFST